MNYYINKLLNYCFHCMKTRNLHYDSYDDYKIDYNNSVVNYMYSKEENKIDEDFVIIEKSK
jgi:hypothetical protein